VAIPRNYNACRWATVKTVRAVALIWLALEASSAGAQDTVRVTRLSCQEGVAVVSEGARLSEVLTRLSGTLQFDLKYWASDDPPVHTNSRFLPADLIPSLTRNGNVAVRYRKDHRCKGQYEIHTVVVLTSTAGTKSDQPAEVAPNTSAVTREPPKVPSSKHGQAQSRGHPMHRSFNANASQPASTPGSGAFDGK
jgi:hypothetical protein